VVVFVKDTTEAVAPVDVQPGELARVGDRFGQRLERPEVRNPLLRAVWVVELLILVQRMR
jgi:hypothetical protein